MPAHRTKGVGDATYARTLARFGEQGVMNLAGIDGYYTLLAMAMNAARPPSSGGVLALPRLPR